MGTSTKELLSYVIKNQKSIYKKLKKIESKIDKLQQSNQINN